MDLLASEYGWSLGDILYKTYPEDFFLLQRQIKMRKIDQYLMDLSITANPHKEEEDAKAFIEELMSQRRWYRGDPEEEAELDIAAFDKFREEIQKDSMMIKAR